MIGWISSAALLPRWTRGTRPTSMPCWRARRHRDYPLVLGTNCAANGFYWRAREFMGAEALSLAFFLYPDMMRDIMAFFGDFIMETSRPVLEKIRVDYFTLNEDLSMKTGPLLGLELCRECNCLTGLVPKSNFGTSPVRQLQILYIVHALVCRCIM